MGLVFTLCWGCLQTRKVPPKAKALPALSPCTVSGTSHVAVTPVPRPYAHWMERHQGVLNRIQAGPADLIFIGNSLTQRWESAGKAVWQAYYGDRNAVNMGFDGDGTQNVLWRLDHGEIDGSSPKLAVVLIGSNHVNGYTVEEISDGIKAICCRIVSKLPRTKILLLSILPRGDASAAAAYRLAKASEEAAKMVDNRTIYYLDIREKFLDADGNVSSVFMGVDHVHLTEEGYQELAGLLEPTIARLLKDRAKP